MYIFVNIYSLVPGIPPVSEAIKIVQSINKSLNLSSVYQIAAFFYQM